MPKFRVIIYRETYTEYITEAENKEKAKEKCWNLTVSDEIDVDVKDSELLEMEEINE